MLQNKSFFNFCVFSLILVLTLTGCENKLLKRKNAGESENQAATSNQEQIAASVEARRSGVQKMSSCDEQYQALREYNKTDFSNCQLAVRSGEFEEKEPVKPRKQNNTVLIFDASGSMAGQVDGRSKLDIAKEAVSKYVDNLADTNVNLSVVVYGHKGNNSTSQKKNSCEGIEEVYYLGGVNSEVVKKKVAPLRATGWTPIAQSFLKAKEILSQYQGEQYNNSILLVSDGKETCDGNPIEIIKELQASGLKVTANVIGFDVGGEDERQLKNIAENGNGQYYSAKSALELEAAMQQHQAFMEKFDFKMKRFVEQLDDMVLIGNAYYECLTLLKQEEALMMLDIYADKIVSDGCAKQVEEKYYQHYDKTEKELTDKYNQSKREWQKNSQFQSASDKK